MNNRSISPWISGDLEKWQPLTQNRTPVRFKRKAIIYYQGYETNCIFIVRSGRVRVTAYTENGMEKQLFIAEKGAMFGELSSLSSQKYRCSAVAIVESEVYRIPVDEAMNLLKDNWEMTAYLIESLSKKALTYQQQILDISFLEARHRVCKVLLNLSEQYGVEKVYKGKNVIYINIRFSHQDVASMVGISRVASSRFFSDLTKDGLIQRVNGYYCITDIEELRDIVWDFEEEDKE